MKRCIVTAVILSLCGLQTHAQTQLSNGDKNEPDRKITHHEIEGTATVSASTHTPLWDAILTLNKEYGWHINYEDAPTVNSSELVDDNAAFHLSHPGFHPKLMDGYSPKAIPFHSTYNEVDRQHADEEIVLRKVLQDYNSSNNLGKYELIQTMLNNYVVVGKSYLDKAGSEVAYSSILTCNISLAVAPMSLHDALQAVANQVNTACKNDLNAMLDAEFTAENLGPLAQEQVFGNYSGMAARDVIEDLLRQEPGLLYYSVHYAPGLNRFYLGTWLTYNKIIGVDGNEILDPVLNNRIVISGQSTPQ